MTWVLAVHRDALAGLGALSDPLAWVVVAALTLGAVGEALARRRSLGSLRDASRAVATLGWAAFGAFWLSLVPYYVLEMRSAVEGLLSLAAVPACLYVAYLLVRGRDSLFVVTRAVAVMGLVFMPVEQVPALRQGIIELVAWQTSAAVDLLGWQVELAEGPIYGYRSGLLLTGAGGAEFFTYINIACTGIGSIAIFAGLVGAVRAPLRRKLRALAVSVGVIWVLNIARNTFVAMAFAGQWFQFRAETVAAYVRYPEPELVSFFVAHNVVAQSLALVALVGITWLVVRDVPEVLTVVEEVAYVATGTEYDLRTALALEGDGQQ